MDNPMTSRPSRHVSTGGWCLLASLMLVAAGASFAPRLVTAAVLVTAPAIPLNEYFIPADDLTETLEQARYEGRAGVVVLFEMNGCGECAQLRADTLNAPALRDYLAQHFATVSLEADTEVPLRDFGGAATTASAFAAGQRVIALPTVVFYDLEGAPVVRQVGRAAELSEWLRRGRYLVDRGFETAPFAAWQPVN